MRFFVFVCCCGTFHWENCSASLLDWEREKKERERAATTSSLSSSNLGRSKGRLGWGGVGDLFKKTIPTRPFATFWGRLLCRQCCRLVMGWKGNPLQSPTQDRCSDAPLYVDDRGGGGGGRGDLFLNLTKSFQKVNFLFCYSLLTNKRMGRRCRRRVLLHSKIKKG